VGFFQRWKMNKNRVLFVSACAVILLSLLFNIPNVESKMICPEESNLLSIKSITNQYAINDQFSPGLILDTPKPTSTYYFWIYQKVTVETNTPINTNTPTPTKTLTRLNKRTATNTPTKILIVETRVLDYSTSTKSHFGYPTKTAYTPIQGRMINSTKQSSNLSVNTQSDLSSNNHSSASPGMGIMILLSGLETILYLLLNNWSIEDSYQTNKNQLKKQYAVLTLTNNKSVRLSNNFMIGSSKACQLTLSAANISRQHARIRYENSIWIIQDLHSVTGTFVNYRRIESQRLFPGDQIMIGRFVMKFYLRGGY
jgi:hypothetical protein